MSVLLPVSYLMCCSYIANYAFIYVIGYTLACILMYLFTKRVIPLIMPMCLKVDLFGYDINKRGTKEGEVKVPETLGLVPAVLYIIFMFLGLLYTKFFRPDYVF